MIEKPEKYGLKRISANHNMSLDKPYDIDEYWYTGQEYTKPDQYLICTDEQIQGDVEQRLGISPGCRYEFPFKAFNTTIRVSFRRKHLPRWREIRAHVEALVRSWVIKGGE